MQLKLRERRWKSGLHQWGWSKLNDQQKINWRRKPGGFDVGVGWNPEGVTGSRVADN